jgi:hypothetical protein
MFSRTLAGIQQNKALYQVTHFNSLLNADLNAWEIASLVMTGIAVTHAIATAAGYFSTWRNIQRASVVD